MKNLLVIIPTYNEKDNIESLYKEIVKLGLKNDFLFVDDNSPDGTSKIITTLAKKDKSVNLIVRKKKEGIGSAHMAGLEWAYLKKYSQVLTMDADFTHKPTDIPRLVNSAKKNDIVIASRYLSKNGLEEWNLLRKFLTLAAHKLTKLLLGMTYDSTGAFRLYNIDKIPLGIFKLVESKGYSFFFESLYILSLNKYKIKEVSVKLPARTYGSSKMQINDAIKSVSLLFQTFIYSKVYKDSYIYTPRLVSQNKKPDIVEKEWDKYWHAEKNQRNVFYDSIAVFYRKIIIRPTLNFYIKHYFKKSAELLHAGCGSGQVDEDLIDYVNISALDISSGALNIYKRLYGNKCKIIHGSIFSIPTKSSQFDGIYNLGVMEHFSKQDIKKILKEFHRVLKKRGTILLFWPPEFGLSVTFLKIVHFILNDVLGKKIKLHPDEITRVKSKGQVEELLRQTGFELVDFNFGPRDLFTYTIVSARKVS